MRLKHDASLNVLPGNDAASTHLYANVLPSAGMNLSRAARICARHLCTASTLTRHPCPQTHVASLPSALQHDAHHLSSALESAVDAVDVAAGELADSEERALARSLSRRAISMYAVMVARAARDTDAGGVVGNPAGTAAAVEGDGQDVGTEAEADLDGDNEMESNGKGGDGELGGTEDADYLVPKEADSDEVNFDADPNPVVRAFGSRVASLKYQVFIANKQRLWIGWSGWF